jgi:hypothetical protein
MCSRRARFACIALSLSIFPLLSLARSENDSVRQVQITSLAAGRPHTAVQEEAGHLLYRWFTSRGVVITEKAEWAIWCDVSSVDGIDAEHVLLAVGYGRVLPKDVMELGKKAEAFYSYLPSEKRTKLPAEGKAVREYMSEGYLCQFLFPVDQEIVVVPKRELKRYVDSMVQRIYDRWIGK